MDKNTGKKKEKKSFLAKIGIAGCNVESDKTICTTKICGKNGFTTRNGYKIIAYVKILGDYIFN